ncbi:MAG: hypothetical protein U5L46_13390 [Agrobacterium sp.]|nr:hypothetical protein [Agrobacterium sp.]
MRFSENVQTKTGMVIILIFFVTVRGIPNPETGFVIDLKVLKDLVEEKAIQKL